MSKKLSPEERKRLIKLILDDIYANIYSYWDFVLDCVKKEVERWSDEDLLRWVEGE